jgi:5-methylcytosine-specific restriction endonuclease McrA
MGNHNGAQINRCQKIIDYFVEQKGLCAYCFNKMTLKLGEPNTASIDHVIPRAVGGLSDKFNEVAACVTCNNQKANKPLRVFLAELIFERMER